MEATLQHSLREQLEHRRDRLTETIDEVGQADDLQRLLTEVDAALDRMGTGAFGRCEVCGGTCTDRQLRDNPMTTYCLCSLSPRQQAELQDDLDMAWRVQSALLPQQNRTVAGWQVHFRYLPAGPVSGDYCDVIVPEADDQSAYFLLGDVSGKGVAASFLMAQLNAVVRSIVNDGVSVSTLLQRVNAHLARSTPSSHFATLVGGRADGSGRLEIGNAGHCYPLVVRSGQVETLDATGFPLGLIDGGDYGTHRVEMSQGDSLVLYTDGITEAPNRSGRRYGAAALSGVVAANHELSPARLADACLRDLAVFRDGAAPSDDLAIMIVRR